MKLAITMSYDKVLVVDAANANLIVDAFSKGTFYQCPGYSEKAYKPLDEVPEMKFLADDVFEEAPERIKVLQAENARLDERYWQLYTSKNEIEKKLKEATEKLARVAAATECEKLDATAEIF